MDKWAFRSFNITQFLAALHLRRINPAKSATRQKWWMSTSNMLVERRRQYFCEKKKRQCGDPGATVFALANRFPDGRTGFVVAGRHWLPINMPISLESNSATMLINQCAHGLAGRPGSSRSISLAFRSQSRIHNNERTNNEPFCGKGPWGEGTRYLHYSFSLSLSLSLSVSLSLWSFPFPVVYRISAQARISLPSLKEIRKITRLLESGMSQIFRIFQR